MYAKRPDSENALSSVSSMTLLPLWYMSAEYAGWCTVTMSALSFGALLISFLNHLIWASSKAPPSGTLEYNPIMVANGTSSVKYTFGCVIAGLSTSTESGTTRGFFAQKFLTKASSEGVVSPWATSPSWFPGIANIGAWYFAYGS